MCLKNNKNIENNGELVHCIWCGRAIYQNIKNGKTGCCNSKCRGYLSGSKYANKEDLKPFRR